MEKDPLNIEAAIAAEKRVRKMSRDAVSGSIETNRTGYLHQVQGLPTLHELHNRTESEQVFPKVYSNLLSRFIDKNFSFILWALTV